MQTAAAMLLLGLSAGAANLHVSYTADGLSVRTGWLSPATTAPSVSPVALPVAAASIDAISKNEFSTEVRELRAEIGAARAADAGVLRQVRALLAESERRQENELALRSAMVLQDVQSQRAADVTRFNRALAQFGLATDVAIKRQQQVTDTISTQLLRVSTQK
jgi:hypothetical protein